MVIEKICKDWFEDLQADSIRYYKYVSNTITKKWTVHNQPEVVNFIKNLPITQWITCENESILFNVHDLEKNTYPTYRMGIEDTLVFYKKSKKIRIDLPNITKPDISEISLKYYKKNKNLRRDIMDIKDFQKKFTQQEIERIKELQFNMLHQNNRGTAPPLLLEIQDVVYEYTNGEVPEKYEYLHNDDFESIYYGNDAEDILKQLKVDAYDNEKILDDDILYTIENNMKGIIYKYVVKGVFFTEKAAKEHLRSNDYHYTQSVRIWGAHAWRNPEMELIFKIVLNYGMQNDKHTPERRRSGEKLK